MRHQLSGFRKPANDKRFRQMYGDLVERHWPLVEREEIDVPTRFGSTHVRRSGDSPGTPIVMIHPTMGSSIGLSPFIGRLARNATVYTPDSMGTPGLSVQTEPIQDGESVAQWLDDTLDALNLDRVHLVGYSEGGYFACLHGAFTDRQKRIATLTLLEPGGAIDDIRKTTLLGLAAGGVRVAMSKDKRAGMRRLGRWMNGGTYEPPDDLMDLVQLAATGYRYRIPRPKKLSDESLGRITNPVHLMLGGDSRLFDAESLADRAVRTLPDVTTYIEPGGGHGFAYENPDAAMDLVLHFINQHEA